MLNSILGRQIFNVDCVKNSDVKRRNQFLLHCTDISKATEAIVSNWIKMMRIYREKKR